MLAHAPEAQVDVGLWALIIAKEFDPTLDIASYLQQLDEMAAEIQRMLAGRQRDLDKLLAVRTFLYEPGSWNGYQPFTYDLNDPLGTKPENQLLSTYLDTRRGNCVSMPTLFWALMERIDPSVPVRGVLVPLHLFVRLHDRQTGDTWNIETTNGGHPARNQWYIEQMQIPQSAIDQDVYLNDLTKHEYLAELINVLTRRERHAGRYKKALTYAELALRLRPKSVNALIQKGALLAWLVHESAEDAQQANQSSSGADHADFAAMHAESERYIAQARQYGWRPETEADHERYLQSVETERARRAEQDR